MINKEKTKLKYGHFGENLPENSSKKVVWQCDQAGCSYERSFTYSYYLKKVTVAFEKHDGKELCQKCSHAHRKGVPLNHASHEIKTIPLAVLPPEVNVERSIEIYGVDPTKLSAWSRKNIVLNCFGCGKESDTKRCNLNTYKSIKETGHFQCIGCWTKKRRVGSKASEETKNKQKQSQINRRQKEKQEEVKYKAVANGDYSIINNQKTPLGKVIPFKK